MDVVPALDHSQRSVDHVLGRLLEVPLLEFRELLRDLSREQVLLRLFFVLGVVAYLEDGGRPLLAHVLAGYLEDTMFVLL